MRWIKLHTKFLDWEWHDIPEMVSLFVHLLILAQHEDYKYRGKVIKRGQLVTSRAKLCEVTGMSQQTIRTCLHRLELTNEITKQSTNYNTLITICNYERYQTNESKANQPINQQTNQQVTNQQTRYKDNNNITRVDNACARDEFFSELFTQQMCMALHIDQDTYKMLADETLTDWEITQHGDRDKRHFLSTMRIKVEAWRKQQQQQPKKTKQQLQAEALEMAMRAAQERAKRYGTDYN